MATHIEVVQGSVDDAGALEHRTTWVDTVMPWGSSFMMHAGIGIVAAFAFYVMVTPREQKTITIVESPPALTQELSDVTRRAPGAGEKDFTVQNRIKELSDGFDQDGKLKGDLDKLTGTGDRVSQEQAWMIAGGTGGSLGVGLHGIGTGGPGRLAIYSDKAGGGGGILPPTRGAMRVVYLLDHSGSMLDTFDYLRVEVKNRINSLMAIQKYSVIMFSEEPTVLGPEQLLAATNENKRELSLKMDGVRAQGQNDDLLEPFKKGFEKAFAMKPELIVFLTDGNFDKALVPIVKNLNKDGKVQISTVAYVQITPQSAEQLKEIADQNGGKYKFVSEKDLGR